MSRHWRSWGAGAAGARGGHADRASPPAGRSITSVTEGGVRFDVVHVMGVIKCAVVHEVQLQERPVCIISVLAILTDEFGGGVDRIDCQGVLALQFENGGRLPSNPVQEIHDHVYHGTASILDRWKKDN